MNRSLSYLLVVAAALSLVGAGCGKKQSTQNPSNANVPQVWLPPEKPIDTNAQNLAAVRAAQAAFQNVRTFRAKLTVNMKEGTTTGQIDVMKPDRFHGVLQLPQQTTPSEIIAVSDALYVKLPDNTWAMISTPSVAKALSNAFKSSVDGNSAVLTSQLPDSAVVKKTDDTSRGCTEYDTTIKAQDNTDISVGLCVAKQLPKFLTVSTAQGTIKIEYLDYNQLITIERPVVPKR